MQTVIKRYIRNSETKQPRGIAIAVRKNDEVFYGYSLLNTTMDKFNKELGLNIAMNRAMADEYQLPTVLDREAMVMDAFNHLEKRAMKYFKDLSPDKIKLMPSNVVSKYTEK